MGRDYGEPIKHDPEFQGPVKNRSCTDVLFLILFLLFVGLWGYIGYYGIYNGNVESLLAPMDKRGLKCGIDSSVIHKPYLVFFDITQCLSPDVPFTGCSTEQVCVESCPTRTKLLYDELVASPGTWSTLLPDLVCQYSVNVNTISSAAQLREYFENGLCAKFVLKSESVLSRCIGDLSALCNHHTSHKNIPETLSGKSKDSCENPKVAQTNLLNRATILDSYVGMVVASWVGFFTHNYTDGLNISTQIVEDLVQSRWYMVGALGVVVLICLIYVVLLRWVVAPVVWVSLVGLLALLSFACYLCYKNYAYYKENPVTVHQTTNFKGLAESIFYKQETWLALLIILAIVLVIIFLMVVFLRQRILIAIALIKEGSKAVSAVKSTFAFPLFPWVLQVGALAYGVVVLVHLLTIGTNQYSVVNLGNCACSANGIAYQEQGSCQPEEFFNACSTTGAIQCANATCVFRGVESPTIITYMHVVNVVAFFWVMFFIEGVSDMILAGTFATWYWSRKHMPYFPLTGAVIRTLTYHLGTVALGALIITIVRVIRILLEYIDRKLKKFDNPFTRCVMCCCKCFMLLLENFLRFINKNAFIMCAIHGKGFCSSAREAFSLLVRNALRVVVLDKVTDFVFFLSKVLISVGVGFAVYYLLKWDTVYQVTGGARLHYNYVPAIILAVVTYLIASIFFNVYATAVDTLFLCFLEDCERNDGSENKQYFMGHSLMKILGKKNKHN